MNKVIWEGWTAQMFINELEPTFNLIQNHSSWMKKFEKGDEKRLKQWCMDNQPYYKKYIPQVFNYFKNKL